MNVLIATPRLCRKVLFLVLENIRSMEPQECVDTQTLKMLKMMAF